MNYLSELKVYTSMLDHAPGMIRMAVGPRYEFRLEKNIYFLMLKL